MFKLIAHVSGKVQMAGYRSRVVIIAKAFDLRGYVRNLPDGRVKIVAEGSKTDLERFLAAIRIENTLIKVEDIKAEFSDAEVMKTFSRWLVRGRPMPGWMWPRSISKS